MLLLYGNPVVKLLFLYRNKKVVNLSTTFNLILSVLNIFFCYKTPLSNRYCISLSNSKHFAFLFIMAISYTLKLLRYIGVINLFELQGWPNCCCDPKLGGQGQLVPEKNIIVITSHMILYRTWSSQFLHER